jgi:hypothetical protein
MGVFKDISGRKYGSVTVLGRRNDLNSSGSWFWDCECGVCGKRFKAATSPLNAGTVKTCGCVNRKKFVARNTGRPSNNIKPSGFANSKRVWKGYRDGAKKRGLSFEIDHKRFVELTSMNCRYCSVEPLQYYKKHRDNGTYYFNGLDRVDNEIGYTESNVVPCCSKCNRAKFQSSQDDFIKWVKQVYNTVFL